MKEKENSVEYGNDDTDSSYIVIDGVAFVPAGLDESSCLTSDDLENGGQERIHAAVRKVANSLGLDEFDTWTQ